MRVWPKFNAINSMVECQKEKVGIAVRRHTRSAARLANQVRESSLPMPEVVRRYKYLDALTTMFVVILLVSNLVAQKICMIGPFAVSGAILLFPITYIFGDVFTEVYGFSASRRAIWLGFFGTSLLYLMGAIVIALPGAPEWKNQDAFRIVFGFIPRILAASLIAFWAGEFANSYTMAKLKLLTNGEKLWTRTIGSTVVGQGVDTVLVITLTFAGKYPLGTLVNIIVTGYLVKVGYEVLATPITYLVIGWLKRSEHADAFDRHEDFNPFSFGRKGA
jgi:queuosine precursor transporter